MSGITSDDAPASTEGDQVQPGDLRPAGFVRSDSPPYLWSERPSGRPVDRDTGERLRRLALPPAWRHVWASADASASLQATGVDARGRTQYRYSAAATITAGERKFATMLEFAAALPAIREAVSADLAHSGEPGTRQVIATVVRILERGLLRVGNERYARDNHTYGLTTLLTGDVRLRGSVLEFTFIGKEHLPHRVDVTDAVAAGVVRQLLKHRVDPLAPLFAAPSSDHPVSSATVNAYLHANSGVAATAKTFRTWGATAIAVSVAAGASPPIPTAGAARRLPILAASVALGDTPTVTRASYLHPLWEIAGRATAVRGAVADAVQRFGTGSRPEVFLDRAVQTAIQRALASEGGSEA